VKRGHVACAALLNPSSAEPLVWPSALKFISELEPNAKSLLEAALMEANRERERRILKGTKNALPSPSHSDDGAHDAAIAEVNSIASCIQIVSLFGAGFLMASYLGMMTRVASLRFAGMITNR
jgi:E3 ubiquitin-protein ligase XBAT32/33